MQKEITIQTSKAPPDAKSATNSETWTHSTNTIQNYRICNIRRYTFIFDDSLRIPNPTPVPSKFVSTIASATKQAPMILHLYTGTQN